MFSPTYIGVIAALLAFSPLHAQTTDFFSVVEATPVNHVNVKTDAGAVGNGLADDTAAIQNAINMAYSQGKEVFFPAGRYKVAGDITPMTDVSLVGSFTGLSMIEGDGGSVYDQAWSTPMKNITVQNLVLRSFGIDIYGSASYKRNWVIKNCVFLDDCYVSWGHMTPGVIQDNIFLRSPQFRGSATGLGGREGAISFYMTDSATVQRNVIGLDLDQLDWLATEFSGYASWDHLIDKLRYLRQRLNLYPDQGQFVNGIYPNRVTNTTIQSNIFNTSPNLNPGDGHDHAVYGKDYTNLKIVANWVRGWPADPSGGLKLRNANGPLTVACNYLDDTGIIYYIQNESGIPLAFQNALTYKNYIKERTNIGAWATGLFYYTYVGASGTEGGNNYDSNIIEAAPGTPGVDVEVGNLGTWNVYPTNYFAGTTTLLPVSPSSQPYASGTIDPTLIAPYQNIAIPSLSIPTYHLAPAVIGFTNVFTGDIPAGTVLGTVTATDSYPGNTWTYSIAAGNESGLFAIDPSTGVVTTAAAIPYTTVSYGLTIAATDSMYGLIGQGIVSIQRGVLRQQRWNGITGTTVVSLTSNANYPNNPSSETAMTTFDYSSLGDNYGTRVTGYVVPSTTDNYTFYIASDDSSELWLSTDGNPAHKARIAYVSGYTSAQQWTKYASQKSVAIPLQAGRPYYVEVLHKEGGGGDNMAVGWETATQAVAEIPSANLAYRANTAPLVVDDSATTAEDTSVSVAVLSNDSDWEGDALSIQSVTQGAHGAVTISGNNVIYTPAANWNGVDSFTYAVTDGKGGVSPGTVTVTVDPVNDAPVFTANPLNKPNAAAGVAYSGSIAGSATDVDAGDTLSFSKISGPAWLSVAASGTLSGIPGGSDVGSNSWTVRVTDSQGATASATLNITVVASSLPSGWTAADVGSVGVSGSASENSGTFTVNGSGADIWDTADAFQFVSQTLDGDGEIRARVTSQTNTNAWAKAGVMLRETSVAGSAQAMMAITPGNGFAFMYRTTAGGTSTRVSGPALNGAPNNWVRLTRSGTLFAAYVSADGASWTQVGTVIIGMNSSISAGLAVTSHDNSVISTVTFDNVSVTPFPAPWQTVDLGTTVLQGSAEYFSSAFTLKGAGTISGTADSFRFVYQALSGDGEVKARVKAPGNTGLSARLGIMIRDSLTAGSPYVFMGVDGTSAYWWQRRNAIAGNTSLTAGGAGTAPNIWVRLVRSGNSFYGYKSSDGINWILVNSRNINMSANVYIGLVDGSGSTTTLNTTVFDNVTVVP